MDAFGSVLRLLFMFSFPRVVFAVQYVEDVNQNVVVCYELLWFCFLVRFLFFLILRSRVASEKLWREIYDIIRKAQKNNSTYTRNQSNHLF
jgi:hypothetical protein